MSRWREIAARTLAEVEDLNRVTARAVRLWRAAGQAETDRDVYLDAVALNLQSFYFVTAPKGIAGKNRGVSGRPAPDKNATLSARWAERVAFLRLVFISRR